MNKLKLGLAALLCFLYVACDTTEYRSVVHVVTEAECRDFEYYVESPCGDDVVPLLTGVLEHSPELGAYRDVTPSLIYIKDGVIIYGTCSNDGHLLVTTVCPD